MDYIIVCVVLIITFSNRECHCGYQFMNGGLSLVLFIAQLCSIYGMSRHTPSALIVLLDLHHHTVVNGKVT